MIQSDTCPVCKSINCIELYPSNVVNDKVSFSYTKTPYSNKTFRVVRCLNCSHIFCNPISSNIDKNYENVVDKEYLKYQKSLEISANLILPIIKRYKSNGRILDVGCATGVFLTKAKKIGYDVEGLELSKWSSQIARKKKIHIYRKKLDYLSRKYTNKYDVITLFGVIEHFEDPSSEIKNIKKLLKPGGILVIWTGDADSIISKILGRLWWYWQGQHIQYFTHKSLNYLGNLNGLSHITTKKYPFVATYNLMNNYLGRYYLRPWIMKIVKPFFILKPIYVLRLPGEMLWIARKSSRKIK